MKACPFCLARPRVVSETNGVMALTYVFCPQCFACGPRVDGHDEEKAIRLWDVPPRVEVKR